MKVIKPIFKNQKGVIHGLVLLVAIGLIAFFTISQTFSFKNNLFNWLFPKPKSEAAGIVALSLTPTTSTVDPNAIFTVDVNIDTKGYAVSAVDLTVTYDSANFMVQSITPSPQFPVILQSAKTTSPGIATIIIGAPLPDPTNGVGPLNGLGKVATLTLKAGPNNASSRPINIDPATQIAAVGQIGNVVGPLTGSLINIGVLPSPLPSPTSTDPGSAPAPTASIVASTAPVISSPSLTVEAESLILPGTSVQVFSDVLASGSKGAVFYTNGNLKSSFITTSPYQTMIVRAKGDICKGAPNMLVTVDGAQKLATGVSATTWTDYPTSLNLTTGSHSISVEFTNDYTFKQRCDRNLRVDDILFK